MSVRRSEFYLFLALAIVGVALLLALVLLPDHREADAEGMEAAPSIAAGLHVSV